MTDSLLRHAALLLRYVKPYRLRTIGLTALLIAGTALQTYNPQLVRRFIDDAQAGAPLQALLLVALAYVGFGLLRRGLEFGTVFLSADLGWRTTNNLRRDLAAHCLSLGPPFHKTHTPGQLIERIDGDVQAMANLFTEFVLHAMGNVLLLVGILVALYLEDWRLGLALTLLATLSLGVLHRLRAHAIDESADEREQSADLIGFLEERLIAVDDIRANGGGPYTMRRFFQCLRRYAEAGWAAEFKRLTIWLVAMVLRHLGDILAFALGAALLISGRITLGTVYLLVTYVRMLFQPVEDLSHQLQAVQRAAAGIARVQELLAMRLEVQDGAIDLLPPGALDVRFDGVSFTYEDGDHAVLRDLSFALAPGASLGLLGRTGCGKTTVSRLLFRLYDPSSGTVRLGGVPLPDLTLDCLRRHVGLVTQDVQLFHASVRDNLTLFDRSVPDATLHALIDDLGLSAWYARLPEGLDTVLPAGSGGLSAGEAQLLALARVFLKDPRVVVLDEPSSCLDPATESLIERALDRLLQGRTAIIIAHRLSTVQRVQEIMIMEGGRVTERGARHRLAADPASRFARLLRAGTEEALA